MKKKSIAVLLFSLFLAGTRCFAADSDEVLNIDWQPPDFVADTAAGEPFHYPADLQGPTIVLFWATWCPYCKALMPHLQSIIDEYDYSVRVVALTIRDDEDPVAFLDKYGYQFLSIPDGDAVAEAWGVKGTPGLFLADATGRVVFSRLAIPEQAYPPQRFAGNEELKNFQKASIRAPFWAAKLRLALDQVAGR